MPAVKNAQLRYRIIDRSIRNKYKPFPDKEELRQQCEESLFGSTHGEHISDSTIEKDLFNMRMDHDAPIKYSKAERGYYYEDPDFSINDIPLNEEEIEAIKFAATILNQFKQVEVFKQFEFAIDKIMDRVTISDNLEDDAINQFVQFETVPVVKGSEFLSPILQGIKEKLVITFDYQSYKNPKGSERTLHPYLLKEYRNRWYVIGYSEKKETIITFGLDRMENLKVTKTTFEPDPSFDPDKFFKHSIGITTPIGDDPCDVILETNAVLGKYLKSQPLHHSQQTVKDDDNGCQFQLHILLTDELIMQILSYGDSIKVVEPKKLAAIIQSKVGKTNMAYLNT